MVIFRFLPRKYRNYKQKIRTDESLKDLWAVSVKIFVVLVCYFVGLKLTTAFNTDEIIWQIWQTITTVGYGNSPPENLAGRIVTMAFGACGLYYFVKFIEVYVEYRQHQRAQIRGGHMSFKEENGYILMKMPELHKAIFYVKEIRHLEPGVPICIVDENVDELPSELINDGVHYVKGSLLREETYKRANINKQKAVIVFPSEEKSSEDGATKSIVELVARFIDPEKTQLMHMLVDQGNEWLFNGLPSVSIFEGIEIALIVQECQGRFTAGAVQKLLHNTMGANLFPVTPKRIIGWTWDDFCRKAAMASKKWQMPTNPFSLVRDGESNTLPDHEETIKEGDTIIIVAKNGFNWNKFEKQIIEL